MIETAVVSFTTLFATIGPIDVAAMFAALTGRHPAHLRRSMAIRGVLVATGILLAFALSGGTLLAHLGISLAALRTAGGILLLLIGIDMVFARSSGGVSTTQDEAEEATTKPDIAVFPLATPLLAGPGAMGAIILLMANAESSLPHQAIVIAMLLAVMTLSFLMLMGAAQLQRVLGVTGMHVVSRIFGVLLSALAVQFLFDGIAASGLLSGA
jgi:multiple antibiotic resistance protein